MKKSKKIILSISIVIIIIISFLSQLYIYANADEPVFMPTYSGSIYSAVNGENAMEMWPNVISKFWYTTNSTIKPIWVKTIISNSTVKWNCYLVSLNSQDFTFTYRTRGNHNRSSSIFTLEDAKQIGLSYDSGNITISPINASSFVSNNDGLTYYYYSMQSMYECRRDNGVYGDYFYEDDTQINYVVNDPGGVLNEDETIKLIYNAEDKITFDGTITDCEDTGHYDISLLNPADMWLEVLDQTKSKDKNNNGIYSTVSMYAEDNHGYNLHLDFEYEFNTFVDLNYNFIDTILHPFVAKSRYLTHSIKASVDYDDVNENNVTLFDSSHNKFRFTHDFMSKETIKNLINTSVAGAKLGDSTNLTVNKDFNTVPGIGKLKKVIVKGYFYDNETFSRTPEFTLTSVMNDFNGDTSNDKGSKYDNGNGTIVESTVNDNLIKDMTNKDGSNTDSANEQDFDADDWSNNPTSSINTKDFGSTLDSFVDMVRNVPGLVHKLFGLLPLWVYSLLGLLLTICIICRVLGR